MTLWQRRNLASLLNCKPSWPITALQILESIDRNPRCSGGELQKSTLLLGVPCPDDLPEVLDHLVLFLIATVVGVFLPVVHVDVRDAADQQFEFALVEDVDQIGRDEFVETGDEGLELLFDTLLDFPFC